MKTPIEYKVANGSHKKNMDAWNAYQKDYMQFNLLYRPDYYNFFASGGVALDSYIPKLTGNVAGLHLLDTCCASDASQAFSWRNLGAIVTACDITPEAIRIAKENAQKLNMDVDFIVADAQLLSPISTSSMDIVFATYLLWYKDLITAARTWYRVLKDGGRLIVHTPHPITYCLEEENNRLRASHSYSRKAPLEYDSFEGTGIANKFGGWSVDLPVVEFQHTLSDIIMAMINTGFNIEYLYESEATKDDSQLSKLPDDVLIIARKVK